MKPRILLLTIAVTCSLSATALALDLGGLSKGLKVLDKVKQGKEVLGDVNKVTSNIGPEEEQALGETVALEIIGRFGGLVRDEEIVRRVNLVGRALARYSSRPDHAWRFGVLNSDTVNAFSAPDGYVFITRGLYDTAADDDQLAAILSHEITHITGRHALAAIEKGEKGAVVVKHVSKRSGDLRQIEAYANQVGINTEKIVKFLLEKGFAHPTEFAADQGARDLAALTGYAPGGLRAVLQDLQTHKEASKKFFSTHPPLSERIKRLPQ
jgi:predicted Zn-dependent protease